MAKGKKINTERQAIQALSKSTNFEDEIFDDFRSNKRVVKKAIAVDSRAFGWSSLQMRDDKELAMLALKEDGGPFTYASDRLKDDKEVALQAVRMDRENIYEVSDRLKSDMDVVYEMVKKSVQSIGRVQFRIANLFEPDISKLCLSDDPIKSVESVIAYEKMQATLAQKSAPIRQVAKLKI